MRKQAKYLLSLLLALCLIAPLHVRAEEPQPTEVTEPAPAQTLSISSVSEFLTFAENCRLDSYSQNLEVTLKADIDLSGADFSGVPIFSGTFDGNGHTIAGLHITASGSNQGLFRYLTDTAVVKNLTVSGEVSPQGSRSNVGGIAGSNAGRLENCAFSGTVSGSDRVGGLAGINTVTGVIDQCRMDGSIHGNHFIGGLAGENSGVIRGSTNAAQINTTVQQNSVDISDITIDTLTGAEAANTVTDIGGIAGTSSGVIRDCENTGNVGYRHMGYNIGGIAGSQSGYITGCENHAQIYGRKEVGGIVGHMEPATMLEYSTDTLQILRQQLDTLSTLTDRAAANAQNSAGNITAQIAAVQDQIENAQDAIAQLIPDRENPQLPDMDSIQSAQSALSSAFSGMTRALNSIASLAQNAASNLNRDMQAISDQIDTISQTIEGTSETSGGSFTDISDSDTDETVTGKVENCVNYGAVLADLNAGGIAGAMALENDLDPEDDVQIAGDSSLNFALSLRAVVLDCENRGTVTIKKQNGGGIVGWQSMGLVKDCLNTGALEASAADHIGGIAGQSMGYIRQSSAKCTLSGSSYVGGIAGSGTVVSDCRSMVSFLSGAEKLGSVLGAALESDAEEPIANNFYLSIDADMGGIDGISYDGCAQPLSRADFLALEALPDTFQTVTVYFVFEDGTQHTVALAPGGALNTADIPAVPEKQDYIGSWEGLAQADLTNIAFDMAFRANYVPLEAAIQSQQLRENGMPLLLVQGHFPGNPVVTVTETSVPTVEAGQTVIEAWAFTLPAEGSAETARYAMPEGYTAEEVLLLVRSADGIWREAEASANGSYLVFAIEPEDDAFCLVHSPADYSFVLWLAGGILVTAAAAGLIVFLAKKRLPKKAK